MDDRDKDLTGLFVRDLDEIPLPARGAWRRVSGRESNLMRASRTLVAAGAVVALLAIALLIGGQLRDRSTTAASPSASPTASATGATIVVPSPAVSPCLASCGASGSPSAILNAIYNDDFGFIVTGTNSGVRIRKESSNASVGAFSAEIFAVSSDGRQIAYFTSATPQQLRVFPAAGNATEQTYVTLSAGTRPGGIVWAADGAGLLYSTETGQFGIVPGPNSATINIYEFAANGRHGTTIYSQTNTGFVYRPLAWDRSANLAAAFLTGEGGFMGPYVTVQTAPDNAFTAKQVDTAIGMAVGTIRASSDGKFVLGVDLSTGDLRWWPTANYAANKTQAGSGKRFAVWRPGTHEIGFMSGDQFWLGDVDKAGAQGLCCTAFGGAPAGSRVVTFRADGGAVVLSVIPTGRGVGDSEFILVRLGSDPKATSGDRVTFTELGGLTVSVRLR